MSEETAKKKPSVIHVLGGLVFGGIGFLYLFGGGIEQSVAADQVKQYEIAKRSGTPMDACVAAGMVSASYLQANDEANYAAAKKTEADDCAKAGLPR